MKPILIAAALALSACTAPSTSGPVATASSVVLTAERGFAAAELVYITAAEGLIVAINAGAIRGATATQIRELNATARKALVDGKAALGAADKARAAATLFDIADRLNALMGGQ